MDRETISKALGDAIYFAKTQTDADRAIVIYDGLGRCHGFKEEKVEWEEAHLSTKMLANFVRNGETALVKDSGTHPEYGERLTAVLSGLGSVLYIPIKNEFGFPRGFLYLDQIGRSTFLAAGFQERIERYVLEVLQPAIHCPKQAVDWGGIKSTEWLD